MDAATVAGWIGNLLTWILGVATLAACGIIGMNVQLWRLTQRFDDHEKTCAEKHAAHDKSDESLWDAIGEIRARLWR